MINELLLLSGNDIPFEKAQLIMHQPTIKEIAFVGEEKFYAGCSFLNFSKSMINLGKNDLSTYSDFELLLIIMRQELKEFKPHIENAKMVLSLIFPFYAVSVDLEQKSIVLTKGDEPSHYITEEAFNEFKEILLEIFCLNLIVKNDDYNPAGEMSRKIANKLKERHKKLSQNGAGVRNSASLIGRRISILAVGEHKDMNELLNYTLYQLEDEFTRYNLKEQWDIHIKALLAGAKEDNKIEDWSQDIHSVEFKKKMKEKEK